MKYQINIIGMHCSGCKNLIKMSLEDVGFEDIDVDLTKNTAVFSSNKDREAVEDDLTNAFIELKDYKYSNLVLI